MLPASDLTAILTNLSALQLEPNAAAQILAAVLAPLLRSSESGSEDLETHKRRAGRPMSRQKKPERRRLKAQRGSTDGPRAGRRGSADGPRQRATRALAANPNASVTAVAEAAGVSRSTVVNARDELAGKARKTEPSERVDVLPQRADIATDERVRALWISMAQMWAQGL
jgi:hypothetical protein